MMKKPSPIDELISKETFFIEMYNLGVHRDIITSFKEDIAMFASLGIDVYYHRKYDSKEFIYYIEPYDKNHGTVGFTIQRK